MLRPIFTFGPPSDIWPKPAFSAAATLAALNLMLFATGHLDLALYTSAGGMGVLYGHGLPYRTRARVLTGVLLGMVASTAVALTASALTTSTAVLVVVAAALAAVQRMLCDAARVGPPGALIMTFVTASCAFVPQRLSEVPAHVALALGGAAAAYVVCMAPALVRADGPERIAVARALEAAARVARLRESAGTDSAATAAGHEAAARVAEQRESAGTRSAATTDSAATAAGHEAAARHGLAALVGAARVALGQASATRASTRQLARLLVHAEAALGTGPDSTATAADRYLAQARAVRAGRPIPEVVLSRAEEREADALRHSAPAWWHALRPGSEIMPIGMRVLVGCAVAGWVSAAFGVGRPYWAIVTAASVFQVSAGLSWHRALHRVVGNFTGLALFTALLPVSRSGAVALIVLAALCQIAAEATIARSYWIASTFVTPMALFMVEFAGHHPAHTLIADRWLDTLVGAVFGLGACYAVTNRRSALRLERALARVRGATGGAAHRELAAALVELRTARDTAGNEWRQRPLPHAEVAEAEQHGHRVLADLVGQRVAEPV